MRRKLVIGNWKMNGSLHACETNVPALAHAVVPDVGMVLCPPAVYLSAAARWAAGSSLALGAQNVAAQPNGACTGEISTTMLRDLGCGYAIVGHSERRSLFGETDAAVAAKARRCVDDDIVPVVCVGETEKERSEGRTESVIARQLDAILRALSPAMLAKCVLAYEPVWAIGTGHTATPAQAQEVHAFIRQRLRSSDAGVADAMTILYGGSVKSANASQLFTMPDVDGGLIGGASLVADEFIGIYQAARSASAFHSAQQEVSRTV